LHRIGFDSGDDEPYYTRPMAAGLPDLVDCARLAEERAVIDRDFELKDLPRLKGVIAQTEGTLSVRFAFGRVSAGRAGVKVQIEAAPLLLCQRCLQSFAWPVSGGSELEFVDPGEPSDLPDAAETTARECFEVDQGHVSLRDLAEEELLLALPIAPKCDTPLTCGKAPRQLIGAAAAETGETETRRPFSVLQDLLKKHDRT
jgi:uncharacterized protein